MRQPMSEKEVRERARYYEALLPEVYSSGSFPEGFELRPLDWALADEVVNRDEIEAVIGGESQSIFPIGTLDVEFLSNDIIEHAKRGEVDLVKNYPCGLKCPGCFSQEDVYGDSTNLMTWQEMMNVIDDARGIGLSSIKYLGPGELLQNPDLFDILKATAERDLPISIFTKGAELGDDDLAKHVYGQKGVRTARELVERLSEYDNLRILLGFNSFSAERQDRMVGSYSKTANYQIVDGVFVNRGISDYTEKRDRALVNLTETGFSDPEKGQRLTLVAAPVGLHQTDEIPVMYAWAAKRNMPLVIAPTMESGPRAIGLMRNDRRLDPEHEKLVDMYVAVYSRAIDDGILTLDQIQAEGISAYMGTSPCNQVANGLYVRLNGQVQICPGRSDRDAVFGNVHDTPISEIWVRSPNYEMGRRRNNWCAAKTAGMPLAVKEEVGRRLSEKYR